MDPMTIDKRIVHRNIEKGLITEKEYDKINAELPDLVDECEETEVSLYKNDEDEEAEDETVEGEGETGTEGDPQAQETPEPEGQTEGL